MIPDFKSAGERSKWIIDHADKFTAVKFLGRGKYERHEFTSLEAAEAAAKQLANSNGGQYMIYACAGIYDTYIHTVSQEKK
jgi:hypothetical protein